MLHESLSLYSTDEAFTLEPLHAPASVARHTLVFVRRATTATKNGQSQSTQIRIDAPPAPTLAQEPRVTVYGVIGLLALNSGNHLIVIKNRLKVAKLFNCDIFRLSEHEIIPIAASSSATLSPTQIADDDAYLAMINALLSSGFWYFSYHTDITKNVQRLGVLGGVAENSRIWEHTDERFFWNKHLQAPLINLAQSHPDTDISAFILPIVNGFISFKQLSYASAKISLGIISRRSKFRAGTRYNRRGVDSDGNVANYVETEQVLSVTTIDGVQRVASYLQTRGSIPLYWSQLINIRYQPKLVVSDGNISLQAYRKHFHGQIAQYGPQIAVNLINKKGYESPLGVAWAEVNAKLNDKNVRYIHFDFHQECKGNRWDRLSKLVGEIEGDLIIQGYTTVDATNPPVGGPMSLHLGPKQQTSVVRTNCMDCLDRTNVVQSVLARRVLPMQLLEFCGGDGQFDAEFESAFKNLWADHADAISLVYSGTGALKTDFTRTGKRTALGTLADGANSVVRYDSFDLFLGNFTVNSLAASPFTEKPAPLRAILLPAGLAAGLVILLLTVLLLIVVSYRGIMYYGTDFVDRPHLVKWNVLEPEILPISERPSQILSHKEDFELQKNK
ncbi:Phosphatidylinositide phosphatase SAC1 [Physocladia obscura]|uniref:Phosphatidylinositide phosphatase SAC1 n=1 Tax=Physocladia obscura TaxID=109957 RepID=A0AAD5T749_9FUNG|nr:Phosphatidylinositide phosphatase SAC1 [Physocladia obscura]